ncbi:MAG: hypothetical protein Q9178_007471 [Gyalolechia marmorata]
MLVTLNLYNALIRFRYPDRIRTLWADALCIDQTSIQERQQQVPLMRRIYSQGLRTLVWIDAEDEHSKLGLSLVSHLVDFYHFSRRPQNLKKTSNLKNLHALYEKDMRKDMPPENQLNAFLQTLGRVYFSRTWIVQEIVVAPSTSVFCGEIEISWTDLITAAKYYVGFKEGPLGEITGDRRIGQVLLIDRDQKDLLGSNTASILALMLRHRRSSATDPRDKIFALLGLTDPSHLTGLDMRVDYTSEPAEVYTRFAISHLQHTQGLDILSVPRVSGQQGVQGLSSWVPDWSVWDGTVSLRWEETLPSESLHQHFDAAAGTKALPTFSGDRSELTLKGLVIDTISRTSVPFPADGEVVFGDPNAGASEIIDYIHKFLLIDEDWDLTGSAYDRKSIYLSTGESLSEVYYQTIYGGHAPWPNSLVRQQYKRRVKERRTRRFLRRCKYLRKRPKLYYAALLPLLFLDPAGTATFGDDDLDTIELVKDNRRLAKTESGRLALVPGTTEIGDQVVVLKGGKVPYILRKRVESWEFIGECYVHGVMYGESFKEDKCHDFIIV